MSYFDIQGYEPQWLYGVPLTTSVHGERLQALAGRRLRHIWLLWDLDDDSWFADGPVLLDFEGEQVEVNHQRFDDLSITWNTVDPSEQQTWTWGDWGHPDDHPIGSAGGTTPIRKRLRCKGNNSKRPSCSCTREETWPTAWWPASPSPTDG